MFFYCSHAEPAMSRIARLTVPGLPHHVTQRGNRREPIFFRPEDQRVYLSMLMEQMTVWNVEVWAYCLMPNHMHAILTPSCGQGLGRAMGEAHRRYTSFINARHGWTGHLFQGRFASVVMDEAHLLAATRYVALNPVRAGLAARAEDWPWSSVHAHLAGRDSRLVRVGPLLERIDDFAEFVAPDPVVDGRWAAAFKALRDAERTNAPVGAKDFLERLRREARQAG